VELQATGLGDDNRVFNLSWHDWLNLHSLIEVSEVVAAAALSRENSRGAHYREDFPQVGSLEESYFTIARRDDDEVKVERQAVDFSIVKPGESLI
jgi:fumarate reductase flavoprotein subunit